MRDALQSITACTIAQDAAKFTVTNTIIYEQCFGNYKWC